LEIGVIRARKGVGLGTTGENEEEKLRMLGKKGFAGTIRKANEGSNAGWKKEGSTVRREGCEKIWGGGVQR